MFAIQEHCLGAVVTPNLVLATLIIWLPMVLSPFMPCLSATRPAQQGPQPELYEKIAATLPMKTVALLINLLC